MAPGHQFESTARNINAGTNSVRTRNVSTSDAATRTKPNWLRTCRNMSGWVHIDYVSLKLRDKRNDCEIWWWRTYVSESSSDEKAMAMMTPALVIVVDCVPIARKIDASVVYPSSRCS